MYSFRNNEVDLKVEGLKPVGTQRFSCFPLQEILLLLGPLPPYQPAWLKPMQLQVRHATMRRYSPRYLKVAPAKWGARRCAAKFHVKRLKKSNKAAGALAAVPADHSSWKLQQVELDVLHVSTFTGTCFTMAGTASIVQRIGMLNFDGTHVADITDLLQGKSNERRHKGKGYSNNLSFPYANKILQCIALCAFWKRITYMCKTIYWFAIVLSSIMYFLFTYMKALTSIWLLRNFSGKW